MGTQNEMCIIQDLVTLFHIKLASGMQDKLGIATGDVVINLIIDADDGWIFGYGKYSPW